MHDTARYTRSRTISYDLLRSRTIVPIALTVSPTQASLVTRLVQSKNRFAQLRLRRAKDPRRPAHWCPMGRSRSRGRGRSRSDHDGDRGRSHSSSSSSSSEDSEERLEREREREFPEQDQKSRRRSELRRRRPARPSASGPKQKRRQSASSMRLSSASGGQRGASPQREMRTMTASHSSCGARSRRATPSSRRAS